VDTVKRQARLIESVAHFDHQFSASDIEGGAEQATLSQIRQVHNKFTGFGDSGEFTLAKLEKGVIKFLLRHRNQSKPRSAVNQYNIKMDSQYALPIQLALYVRQTPLHAWEVVNLSSFLLMFQIFSKSIKSPYF
jgi:hypothetical protein